MRFLLIISLLLFLTGKPGAQNAPFSAIDNVITCENSAVIHITVKNFNEIGACGFKILYDSAIASAVNVESGENPGGNLDFNLSVPGQLMIGWYSFPSVSLQDSSVLLKIFFSRIKLGATQVSFSELGNDCYFSNSNFQTLNDEPVQDYYVNGSITFTRDAPHIFAPQIRAVQGNEVEVPVTVKNYSNIGKYVLELDFDTTVLSLISDNDEAGYDNYICTPRAGKILLEAKNNTEGISLPDSSILINLTFLYKGGSSNLSWNYEVCSFFGNPPAFLRLNTTGNENFFTDGSIVNVAGNDDINGSSAVKIFPNPCNSYFKLIVPDCYKFCRAEIVSFTGLLLDSFLITGDRTTTCTLPADLKEGLYFIRIIKGNSETESYKLLVNR